MDLELVIKIVIVICKPLGIYSFINFILPYLKSEVDEKSILKY